MLYPPDDPENNFTAAKTGRAAGIAICITANRNYFAGIPG